MNTLLLRTMKSRTVDIQPLSWSQRLLLSVAGIAMVGVGALFFLLMLPVLAVGVGTFLLRRNNGKASIGDLDDYIDGEYSEEKPSFTASASQENETKQGLRK